jgi:hypothetical protein
MHDEDGERAEAQLETVAPEDRQVMGDTGGRREAQIARQECRVAGRVVPSRRAITATSSPRPSLPGRQSRLR